MKVTFYDDAPAMENITASNDDNSTETNKLKNNSAINHGNLINTVLIITKIICNNLHLHRFTLQYMADLKDGHGFKFMDILSKAFPLK